MFFLSRHWKVPRVVLGLMCFEFPLTVACLTLTGIAAPNLYRDKLWKEGGELGFNSKPSTILYAYANYKPVTIPLIWSQFSTNFNLVISVFSMFLWLTKGTMFITNVFWPVISFVLHGALLGLWSYSLHIQTSPDLIDTNPALHNHGVPWYISQSCSIARTRSVRGYCMQAKAFFAVSVIAVVLFSAHVVLAIWSAIPTRQQKIARLSKIEEKKSSSPLSTMTAEEQWQRQWELGQVPPTPGFGTASPKVPFTPRTMAFQTLGGTDEVRPASAAGTLPLRQRYDQYYQ